MFKMLSTLFSNSANAKGRRGELQSSFFLTMGLNEADFKLFHDITLHTDDNTTTQIDHIIISRFGIFIIETKNYSGWIFGGETQYKWTQSLPNKTKNQFLNPLIQNKKHAKTVQDIFGITDEHVFSVIVFMEKATFKTELPRNVMHLKDMNGYIRSFTQELFSDAQLKSFEIKLNNRKLAKGSVADTVHMTHINRKKEKHKQKQAEQNQTSPKPKTYTQPSPAKEALETSPTCPKCASELVMRTVKKGENAGKQFYGCSSFPKCRYTKNV